MKILRAPFLGIFFSACFLWAGDNVSVTVSHGLDAPRPSETIAIPWTDVNAALPGAYLQKIAIKDAAGNSLPYQVTNVAPQAKDPKNVGAAYGDLIFQYSFAAGEKSAQFTIERTDVVSPVFPAKVFARYVPERLDDFAWENDKVAHRTYGQALGEPAPAGVVKEVLVTSGLDIWSKRVSYPIVERWYNKGHDHYHKDQGEGMDMFSVGKSRGCGGTGVWDGQGQTLFVGRNYKTWKVIANGPIRAIFELTYDAWDANGVKVSEVKRFTVDAGHNLDRLDSTFTFEGVPAITVAVGLNKNNADKGQEPRVDVIKNKEAGILAQWTAQKSNGSLGTAVLIPGGKLEGYVEDALNELALTKAEPGKPVTYYVGAGWTRTGDFPTKQSWEKYLLDFAARLKSPITVKLGD
jgi:pectinesterase